MQLVEQDERRQARHCLCPRPLESQAGDSTGYPQYLFFHHILSFRSISVAIYFCMLGDAGPVTAIIKVLIEKPEDFFPKTPSPSASEAQRVRTIFSFFLCFPPI